MDLLAYLGDSGGRGGGGARARGISGGCGGDGHTSYVVEVLLYVHRNRRFIMDGSPGRPPRLSHSS